MPLPTGEVIELPDIDPATGQQRIENNIAQSEVDIYIDDVSDVVAPQIEQWQALVELKKVDVNNEISFEDLIQAAPNIRNKDQILERMQQRKQEAAQQGQQPSPEEQKLAIEAKRQEMLAAGKAQEHQQKLAFAQQEHQQMLAQKAQEHTLEMRTEVQKAELKAKTDAALAQRKLDHDLVADARKQELTSHYDGERAKASLDHESRRESLELQRAAEKTKAGPGDPGLARLEKQIAAMAQAIERLAARIEKPAKR
jgi:hypothetical protein